MSKAPQVADIIVGVSRAAVFFIEVIEAAEWVVLI
jgi:hypothetical protein